MPDTRKAAFLSYASQDAEAARRLCEALRSGGVEVWFDADGGLEHGDEWDAKIRKQIKECVLFIPIISANTQARHEGYFRIEWDLAAERARGIASGVAFILPIVIDDTRESEALVPDRFRAMQWTRLPAGTVASDVQVRFGKLWLERTGGARPLAAFTGPAHATRLAAATTAADDKSIAVLPFANMSADAENEYFSDGMTEEIINALVQVPDLRVAARTSVFAFKGKADDLRAIAAKLNVRTVLEGSVRKAGNKLRITAQLINAADGFHLWSERFDRGLEDIFAVQDEIAQTIAEKLKAKLAGGAKHALVIPATDDVEAYELYLQGRYFWNQRGAGLLKGLTYFKAALARDPDYALAYTGIADTYSLLSLYGHARAQDVIPKARAAAERALAIDPGMAEAHCALGFILVFFDRDVAAARREFQQAIALKPSYVSSYSWAAAGFSAHRRHDEAVATAKQAVQLEPLSLPANVCYAWTLIFDERGAEAVVWSQRVVELEPRFFAGHWMFGQALIVAGRMAEGVAALRQSVELSQQLPWMVATLGCGLVCAGQWEEARSLLEALRCRAATEYVPGFALAMLEAALGEEARAMATLERAITDGDAALVWLQADMGPLIPMGIPAADLNPAKRAVLVERLGINRGQPR